MKGISIGIGVGVGISVTNSSIPDTVPEPLASVAITENDLDSLAVTWVAGSANPAHQVEGQYRVNGGAWTDSGSLAGVVSDGSGTLLLDTTATHGDTVQVRLRVSNGEPPYSAYTQSNIVTMAAPEPVAGFFANPLTIDSGGAETSQITDVSTGVITSYLHQCQILGGGFVTYSTIAEPVITAGAGEFADLGTYDLQLTVFGPGGQNTRKRMGYLTVTNNG